jgi:DNA (cytosine-5)-methyltransferase 1
MNELSLFSGAGGGLLATRHLLGWRCVGYVEMAEYPCRVLEARINDGLLSRAPIFQMHTRDFIRQGWPEKYRGLVDVITAGFPCQPFATNGKRAGPDDDRNAWPDTIRIIRAVRPRWVFLENSTKLLTPFRDRELQAYIGQVIGDLATSGYVGDYDCYPASTLGFDHERDRVWIIAHAEGTGRAGLLRRHSENGQKSNRAEQGTTLDTQGNRLSRLEESLGEPAIFGTDDGLAYRLDRLKAAGNGQVPAVAATVWRLLTSK